MNCPECNEPTRWTGTESRTLVGYFSSDGHNHDDNCRKRGYVCPNGHLTMVARQNRCATEGCSWVGKASCWCHTGPHEPSGGTTVCFEASGCGEPYPHHHVRGEKHAGGICDDCVQRENRIPFVKEWPS